MRLGTARSVSALAALGMTAAAAIVALVPTGDGATSAGAGRGRCCSSAPSAAERCRLQRDRRRLTPVRHDLERSTLSPRAAEQGLAAVRADEASALLESIKAARVGAVERATRAEERERILAAPPRELGEFLAAERGYTGSQWSCLDSLWQRESNWNPFAQNRSSGAYGIPQSLPGSKMATVADDWRTNPATQITWGLNYIEDRYGTPCGAWGHSQNYGWY